MALIQAFVMLGFALNPGLLFQKKSGLIKEEGSLYEQTEIFYKGRKESAMMLSPNVCMQTQSFRIEFRALTEDLGDLTGFRLETGKGLNLNGDFPATLHIQYKFLKLVSQLKVRDEDSTVLEKIRQIITEDHTGGIDDGRSDIIVLEKPIEYIGMTIKALRLKGVLPQVDNNEVLEYVEGAGKTQGVPTANNDGEILNTGPINTPFGTMFYGNAKREFKYHKKFMAKNIPVDFPIGEAYYNNLLFKGEKVGFVLFAMESVQEDRCNPKDDEEHVEALAGLLRKIHGAGFIHRFPHFGNFAKVKTPEGIKFTAKDLDRVLEIGDFPEGKREVMTIAFRWLDISRMLWEYLKDYREWPDETAPMERTFQVFQKFARGYFGKN